MKWCSYKNTGFPNILRLKINNPTVNYKQRLYKKYNLNTNTCMPFVHPVNVYHLLIRVHLRPLSTNVSLWVDRQTDPETYHRDRSRKQNCSIKCKDSFLIIVFPLGTSLSSAAVSPLSVWTARSQTSLPWTFRRPSWSPACKSEGLSDRCFHTAWKS